MHFICRTQQLGSRDLCSTRPPNFILVLKEAQENFPHISQHFYPYRKVFLTIFAFAKKCGGRPPSPWVHRPLSRHYEYNQAINSCILSLEWVYFHLSRAGKSGKCSSLPNIFHILGWFREKISLVCAYFVLQSFFIFSNPLCMDFILHIKYRKS